MTHVKKGEAYDRLTDHSQSRSDTEIYHVIMSKSCGMRCNSAITWMVREEGGHLQYHGGSATYGFNWSIYIIKGLASLMVSRI